MRLGIRLTPAGDQMNLRRNDGQEIGVEPMCVEDKSINSVLVNRSPSKWSAADPLQRCAEKLQRHGVEEQRKVYTEF